MELDEMAKLFAGMAVAMEVGFTAEMEAVGRTVEHKAKSLIGDSKMVGKDISPLAPWVKLADTTKADRVQQGYDETSLLLRTGEMRDSIEHNAGPMEARIGSDNDKMLWQERGTPGNPNPIPPRSVLGAAAILLEDEIATVIWLGHAAVLQGGTKGQGLNVSSTKFSGL